ncbi:hypothetical protein JCM11251_003495 [Rhodosporidiobolus azoricus]
MTVALPTVTPIAHPSTGPSSLSTVGATITNLSLASLFDPTVHTFDEARNHPAFKRVEEALYRHKVVVIKGQQELGNWPERQFDFVRAFDPCAPGDHGHNDATASHKGQKSLLYGIGNSITGHAEVKLVGGGKQGERFGGLELKQAMDASLFRTSLPLVTSLLCLRSPSINPSTGVPRPLLTVKWEGEEAEQHEMQVPAGATGFIEDQWSSPSRGNSNGLGTFDDPSSPTNNNTVLEDLPPYDAEKDVKTYPMAVLELHPRNAPAITDLSLIRRILNQIQLPALRPEYIWAPGYEEGDLVLFDNRAVYHSATDYPESWGTRTMLQAHVAASSDPK